MANREIDDCREMAKNAGATPSPGKIGQVGGSIAVGGPLLGEFFVDGLDEFV